MTRLFLIFGIVLLTASSAIAQRSNRLSAADRALIKKAELNEQIDPKAKAILNDIKKKYEAYGTLEIKFKLSISVDGEVDVQTGTIVQQDNRFRLETKEQMIISDGKTIWFYLKNRNEVQINNTDPDDETNFLSPNNLLRIYESNQFVYALMGEARENGRSVQAIEFKPREEMEDLTKMRMIVDKKNNEMVRIKAFTRDGAQYTIDMLSVKKATATTDKVFSFDKSKFPGVTVEDLRID